MLRAKISLQVCLVFFVASMTIAVTACTGGGQKRGYAVPSHLCGTHLSPKLLDPFLPGGRKIDVHLADTGIMGERRCNIEVDGDRTLSLSTVWSSPGTAVSQMSASWWDIDVSKRIAKDRSHSYSEEGGVSKVACPHPDKNWRSQPGQLFAVVYSLETAPDNEQEMKDLVTGYAKAIEASGACN